MLSTFTPAVVYRSGPGRIADPGSKAADGKLFKGKARKAVLALLATVLVPEARVEPGSLTPTARGARRAARRAAAISQVERGRWPG